MNKNLKPFLAITKWLTIFLITFLIAGSASAQYTRQTVHSFPSKFGPNAYVGYVLYLPRGYDANPSRKYPVLFFLHGSGEKSYMATDSSQIGLIKTHGPPKLIEYGKSFPFIVISPQCPFSDWETPTEDNYVTNVSRPGEFVDEIVEKMKTLYRIDTDSMYLTGLSMGAAATNSYIMLHGDKIAAAIPISGWVDDRTNACNVAKNNVGVWAFNNDEDPKSLALPDFVREINKCTPAPSEEAKSTVYVSKEHDAWTKTYDNTGPGIAPDNIYSWLLRHSKKPAVITATENLEYNFTSTFSIYPTPAKDDVTIRFSNQTTENVIVQLFSNSTEVMRNHISVVYGMNELKLNVGNLQDGLYLISVTGANKKQTGKLLISR